MAMLGFMHHQLMIGLEGLSLTPKEEQWLREKPPLGVILFARNIDTPEQVKALLEQVRQCTGESTWAAIDEEGGRVNRIPWKPFTARKHAAEYGKMFAQDARATMRLVFDDAYKVGKALKDMGFTHNCAPILDVYSETAHRIIGERSYGSDVQVIAALAAACTHGLQKAGVQAVGKHFPGHGRANADSHVSLPEVNADLDILLEEASVFELLAAQGLEHIMTAHVVYTAVNQEVATFSNYWMQKILRTHMSFTGKIWSDDLCMKGAGSDVKQAMGAAQAAGCDVLLVCDPEGVAEAYA
jgi:beta-N-acetylhexosaminidase